jgi:hypothetical protein
MIAHCRTGQIGLAVCVGALPQTTLGATRPKRTLGVMVPHGQPTASIKRRAKTTGTPS